jgi:cell wall-associated NlpC family hydrolase
LITAILLGVGTCLAWADQVIGKLGQAIQATRIYAAPDPRSRVYYSLKPYQYVIINPSKYEKWLKVRMQNGRDGYVVAEAVARLPYSVSLNNVQPSRHASLARGGTVVPGSSVGSALANYSLQFVGTPYKWGGNDLLNGVDCSGFVKQIYGQIGVNLPRTAAQQVFVGTPITRLEDLQPGDRLYFWDYKRGKIGHTGMYLGRGYFVHSSSSRGAVTTDYLGKERWLKILVAARR